ncbi:MAG TPA: DUF4131 domain-containing protein, partial [Trueperaceae bacterium]|nr:DUF4131 domain-containing protein [Trueperaceae bacterium]
MNHRARGHGDGSPLAVTVEALVDERSGRGAPPVGGRFVPWPLPAAGAAACGVLVAALAPGSGSATLFWLGVAAATVVATYSALAAPARRRRRGRAASGRPAVRAMRPVVRAMLPAVRAMRPNPLVPVLVALSFLVSGLRYLTWENAPNPATDFLGQERHWQGRYDGVYFRAVDPVRAKFALVARVDPPIGRLTVLATAQLAPGKRNPGGFDYRAYLRRRGVHGQLFVDEVIAAEPAPGPVAPWPAQLACRSADRRERQA